MTTTLPKPAARQQPRHWYESGPLATMRREFEELIENFWNREADGGSELAAVAPRIDLSETDDSVEVVTDLPGVKPEDVTVELRDNCLVITAEHKEELEEKPEGSRKYHRVERRCGRYSRSIWLPSPVEEGKVQANMDRGVLRVTLPKTSDAQTLRIPVNG